MCNPGVGLHPRDPAARVPAVLVQSTGEAPQTQFIVSVVVVLVGQQRQVPLCTGCGTDGSMDYRKAKHLRERHGVGLDSSGC